MKFSALRAWPSHLFSSEAGRRGAHSVERGGGQRRSQTIEHIQKIKPYEELRSGDWLTELIRSKTKKAYKVLKIFAGPKKQQRKGP